MSDLRFTECPFSVERRFTVMNQSIKSIKLF